MNEGMGLRRLRPWREALVSKHATNMLTNPGNVWVQLVKSKYQFTGSWTGYTKPKGCSWVWRSICDSARALAFHCKACVGLALPLMCWMIRGSLWFRWVVGLRLSLQIYHLRPCCLAIHYGEKSLGCRESLYHCSFWSSLPDYLHPIEFISNCWYCRMGQSGADEAEYFWSLWEVHVPQWEWGWQCLSMDLEGRSQY